MAALALGASGCTKFFDTDAGLVEADTSGGDAGDGGTLDPGGVDPGGDPGRVDVPDAPADPGPDLCTTGCVDTPDAQLDVPDVPPCTDLCPTANQTRCSSDNGAIETCTQGGDGCLLWIETTDCAGQVSSDLCKGPYQCSTAGGGTPACVEDEAEAVVCTGGEACRPDACNPNTGECETGTPLPVGSSCDDGDPCTTTEICNQLFQCVGFPDTSQCSCTQTSECGLWEDEDFCNGAYECIGGVCRLQPPVAGTCAENPDQCLNNVCEPATGNCVAEPAPVSQACDDGDQCSLSSFCNDGACSGFTFKDCPAGTCEIPTCDAVTGTCGTEIEPNCCGNGIPEGAEQCDDGDGLDTNGCSNACVVNPCVKRAIGFDGAGACAVAAGATFSAPYNGTLTIEFFVRPYATAQDAVLWDRLGATVGHRLEYSDIGGGPAKLRWLDVNNGGGIVASEGPDLVASQWQHVAVVRTVTAGSAVVSWYHNGIAVGTGAPYTLATGAVTGDGRLGCEAGGRSFAGDLDELRISALARYTTNFSPPAVPFDSDANTLALWHFDDRAPGLSPDQTGNGQHLLWQGAAPVVDSPFAALAAAKAGCAVAACSHTALVFSGAQQGFATVATPSALDGLQDLTVEFYLRFSVNTKSVLVSRSTANEGAQDWHIELIPALNQDARLRWTEAQFGGADFGVTTTSPLSPDTCYHIAVSRALDEIAGSATVRWYINGVAEGGKTINGALALDTTQDLYLGSQGGTALFFTGSLDELRISEGDVYGGQTFTPPAAVEALWNTLALYHFDEGSGGYAYNAVPTGPGPAVLGNAGTGAQFGVPFCSGLAPCP